jgi:hypothetical protein
MSQVFTYLNWLCREQTNSAVNVLIKQADGSVVGKTVATVDEAVDAVDQFGDGYSAVWASVHLVNPSAIP